MFEINKLKIEMEIKNGELFQNSTSAIFGNIEIKIDSLAEIKGEETVDKNDEFYNTYENHYIEAEANEMVNFLHNVNNLKDETKREMRHILRNHNNANSNDMEKYFEICIEYAKMEKLKESMIRMNNLAYMKAQKIYWEEKINKELSQK